MSEPTDILALIDERLSVTRLGKSTMRETDLDLIAIRKAGEALRAVLDLHQPKWSCGNPQHTNPEVGCPDCAECCIECGDYLPCPTVQAIADALGVEP